MNTSTTVDAPSTRRTWPGAPTDGGRLPSTPPWWLCGSEGLRSLGELAEFWAELPNLRSGPRGDGHAVLVIPGFTADDASTEQLRRLIAQRGFDSSGWGLGTNLGPTRRTVEALTGTLRDLNASHGRVSLVGWSLGGIMSRGLARLNPDLVRGVITLGSPYRLDPRRREHLRAWPGPMFEMVRHFHDAKFQAAAHDPNQGPLPVPATAVTSRSDGMVPWEATVEETGETSETVFVNGSHGGLGHNAAAAAVVLDRLLQPEGQWQRYGTPTF